MKSKLLTIATFLVSMNIGAGELVTNATIVELGNTNNNTKDFGMFLKGGRGICSTSGRYRIVFPESKMGSQSTESYNQSFSIALSALATGMKVRIHNFEDNSCNGANFISVTK